MPNGGMMPRRRSDGPAVRGRDAAAAAGGRGQAQVITTKTLLIYGTGRSGGAAGRQGPELYAVDKATGKQVGAVQIPAKTTARADDVPAQRQAVTSCSRPGLEGRCSVRRSESDPPSSSR